MARVRNFSSQGGMVNDDYWATLNRYDVRNHHQKTSRSSYYDYGYSSNHFEFLGQYKEQLDRSIYARPDTLNSIKSHNPQSFKRRKFSASRWEDSGRYHWQARTYDNGPSIYSNLVHPPPRSNNDVSTSSSCKRDRTIMEDDEPFLCPEMRLRDVHLQEKMVLTQYVKHICGTRTVPSFRVLVCSLSCK